MILQRLLRDTVNAETVARKTHKLSEKRLAGGHFLGPSLLSLHSRVTVCCALAEEVKLEDWKECSDQATMAFVGGTCRSHAIHSFGSWRNSLCLRVRTPVGHLFVLSANGLWKIGSGYNKTELGKVQTLWPVAIAFHI